MTDPELVEKVARASANDESARLIACKRGTVPFDEMDPETQEFWCCIARAAIAAYEAEQWRPIETAPKTGDDLIAKPFLGWCPDDSAPGGGDIRVCWWEPRMNADKGQWYGDRDLPENPILWRPLPAPPVGEG